jgi:hypothetical protein
MLKLLKYEFRKAMTAMLIMLGITAAAQGYFLAGLYVLDDWELHSVIAAMLLMFASFAAYIFVLVRGVASYSSELKSRSGYLIFMTPHSTRKIMASKFLFTLILCAIFGGLYALLGFLDFRLLLEKLGEYEEFLTELNEMLTELGIHTDQIAFGAVFTVIYIALSMLSFFAVAYLAITLSHTFFRDKKWRWVMALVFYMVINYAISFVSSLFPMVYTALNVMDAAGVNKIAAAYELDTTPDLSELLIFLVPQTLVSLATILVSLFGCAWMLEKKISL